ncbi:MAG: hypothetical protein WB561_22225, partial [Terracidiphilus sp.]
MPDEYVLYYQADKAMVHTGGEVFSDGSVLELIQGPKYALNLLSWDGRTAKTAEQFVRGDETFVPLCVDPSILRAMRLPSGIAKYGSTRELFTAISGLISRATQAGDSVVLPLTFFVFATWLADILPVAPFVWIVTPPTTTAAPLGQLLGLLCRRAFVVSDFSSARFQSLPMDLQPTLLTEIFQPTRRALSLLRASTRHGAFVAAGGKATDAFCAKIVFAPEPLRDPATAGFPLELVLPPTRQYVPPIRASEVERIATEYQAKLLRYRLVNRAKVRAPAFDMNQFTVPMQEVACSLAAAIADDDELQSKIAPFLKPLDHEIRADRASLLQAIVLEVLLVRCHGSNDSEFPVTEMTGDVKTVLRGRGDMLEVSPEMVGWALRALGLNTGFITGGRKGLSLLPDVCERIHKLAAAYGVRTLRELPAKPDCTLCQAMWGSQNVLPYT